MELEVLRFSSQVDDSLSIMSEVDRVPKDPASLSQYQEWELVNHRFWCFGLEDEYRVVKVKGETRISAGRYPITLREEGGNVNPRYAKRFPKIHKGMLHIQGVPNFTWVYIHCGNTDDHTDACYLVGDQLTQNITDEGFLGASSAAYRRIYPKIAGAILSGEEVWITFVDYDEVTG